MQHDPPAGFLTIVGRYVHHYPPAATPAPPVPAATAIMPPIDRLNLIYHVYSPLANDVWRKNLRQLRRRLHVFNGRRVVSIATGPDLACPRAVKAELGEAAAEYLEVPNDRSVGEVAAFGRLLAAVRNTHANEATFYAHAKGTGNTREDAKAIEYWRNAMYHALLDDPQEVRETLRKFPCVGCFKMIHPAHANVYPSGLDWGKWHYSGTYFWFRHDRTFGNSRWPFVPHDYYGAEAWLSGLFEAHEAASLHQPWPADQQPAPNPYVALTHANPIPDPPDDPRFTIVIPCKGRLHHVQQFLPSWRNQETPAAEILVVDYDCPQGTADWLREHAPDIRCIRVTANAQRWSASRCRNIGAVVASGDWIVFADADAFLPPDFLSRVRQQVHRGYRLVMTAYYNSGRECLLSPAAVEKALFHEVRGYDEMIPNYGHEDTDFYGRCVRAIGGDDHIGRIHNTQCMAHDDSERMAYLGGGDKWAAIEASSSYLASRGEQPVNPAGYGLRGR